MAAVVSATVDMDSEEHIEQLLSEKLMEGYVLLETSCPACSTPLVKNQLEHNDHDDDDDDHHHHKTTTAKPSSSSSSSASASIVITKPVLVPSTSFVVPFEPVAGVPYCVGCSSHVITKESEITLLENCQLLKKGDAASILESVHPSASTATTDESRGDHPEDDDDEEEEIDERHQRQQQQQPQLEPEVIDVTELEDEQSHQTPQQQQQQQQQYHASSSTSHSHTTGSYSSVHDKKKEEEFSGSSVAYSVRREIATKVLGAKMLQGYALMEKQCDKCGMPMMMAHKGDMECVVCPALLKRAKKQIKAQQKLAEESVRLQEEIKAQKAKKAEEEKKAIELAALEEKKRHEEALLREKERLQREEHERAMALQREKEAEHARRMAIIEEEKKRVAAMEAEQARLLQNAKEMAEKEAREQEEQKRIAAQKEQEELAKKEELRKSKAEIIEKEYAAATERLKLEEQKIAEDTKKLEQMEQRRRMGITTAFENMNRDVLIAEHRKRLEEKAKLDFQIARLEQDRIEEQIESRMLADQKRAESEELMIATLEAEANAKAKAAEDAIRKAKAALEHVHSARREVIAHTIAMAEYEAIAEAESIIKKEREDYKAPVILPSASDIKRENWETLRLEGRSVMTRRVMAGWVLLAEFCEGEECYSSPLITKDGKKECVVCGGCGNGKDGAYLGDDDYEVVPTQGELEEMRAAGVLPESEATGYEIKPNQRRPISPSANFTFEEIQADFDTKRDMVSKEIGKRMIEGWTLLDVSCPNCVMPLMMDTEGTADICVLCGLVSTIQENDGSTIKKEDVEIPTQIEEVEHVPVPSAAETVPGDGATMDSTIPTVEDMSALPTAPTFEKTESKKIEPAGTLSDSIRLNSSRPKVATPRGDPPSSADDNMNSGAVDADAAPIKITLSKSLDLSKENDVRELVAAVQKSIDESEKSHGIEHSNSKLDVSSAVEIISDRILKSPSADEAKASLSMEEVTDLVEVYIASNMDESVSDEVKHEVAVDVKRKLDQIPKSSSEEEKPVAAMESTAKKSTPVVKDIIRVGSSCVEEEIIEVEEEDQEEEEAPAAKLPTPEADGVIHLEELPSPQAFKFDMMDLTKEEEAKSKVTTTKPVEEASVATSTFSKKARPTPESLSRPRKPIRRGMPPRPDFARPASVKSQSRTTTPRFNTSPRKAGVIVVGGPSDYQHYSNDGRSVGEGSRMSRAESVATEALDSILDRIERAKAMLLKDDISIQDQLSAANLIEKLAQAAVAVKTLEKIDY